MINFVLSVIFCTIPDTIYYYLMIKNIKNLKSSKKLYLLIFIGYILFNMLLSYNLYLYLLFDIYIYFALKILAKSKINDFFVVILTDFYYVLTSTICYFAIPNYLIAFVINKILMFMPLIFKNKLRNLYVLYTRMWNRDREVEQPVKSITIRNICIVLLNSLIVILYYCLLYIINS